MHDRSATEPADYVIWGAWGLLAVLLALGSAFSLWTALHRLSQAGLVDAAVGSLAFGLALLGFAVNRRLTRLFLVVYAVTLVLAYAIGAPHFSKIA